MKSIWFVSPVVLCSALSGCAPLQQAPLVYSSKVVVGLDVSANVAENQGGSINIGVKTVDSAYVPVAVSKQLDQRGTSSEKTFDIQRIEARYGEGTTADSSDGATNAERTRKIDGYFAAKQASDAAVDQQTKLENQISAQSTLLTQLDSLKSGLVAANNIPEELSTPTPGVSTSSQRTDALKLKSNEIAKLNADKGAGIKPLVLQPDGSNNADAVISDIDGKISELKKAKSLSESQLPELKGQREVKADRAAQAKAEAVRVTGLSSTSKTDAMSVYGRFDTNGSGGTSDGKANLLVGKVFSTGLASQNLTEAVKLEAKSRCMASGFDFAKNMPDADRKTFFDSLSKVCMTLQSSSGNK